MWRFWTEHETELRKLLRDAAHAVVFLLGVGAVGVGILTQNLGLVATGITMFGLVGIVRA